METNSERRRRKLAELCAQKGLHQVAENAGLNWASLDQIIKKTLLPPKKDGTRSVKNLGDDAARKIEHAENLGEGWFDSIDATISEHAQAPSTQDAAIAHAPINPIPATLPQLMQGLSGYFEAMDASTRKMTMALLEQLAENPGDHARIAAMIELSIRSRLQKAA